MFLEVMKVFKQLTPALLFLIINTTSLFSQGGWDLQYISMDSLSPKYLGEEVRIDFKGSAADTLHGKLTALKIRGLLFKKDTVSFSLGEKVEKFKERWTLYPDQGILREQTLERVGAMGEEKTFIREMYLVDFDETTLTVEALVYRPSEQTRETLILNKSAVKGLLVRY
ncbi:MAG: hypothetical protein R3C61_15950 [Bacteroidia bacterium]